MTKFSDPSLAGWGYPILLVVLLGTFAVQPWAAQTVIGTTFVRLTYSSVLIGALIVLSRHRLLVAVGILRSYLPRSWVISLAPHPMVGVCWGTGLLSSSC